MAKLNLVTWFPRGAVLARVIKAVDQLQPKCGTRKFPMFLELVQNHCIFLRFDSIGAEVVFFRALEKIRDFPRPTKSIEFSCISVLDTGILGVYAC